jgi:hypothetical protein
VKKSSKSYYQKKNKENYDFKKKLSKEYQEFGSTYTKPFSQYVRERKKHLGK